MVTHITHLRRRLTSIAVLAAALATAGIGTAQDAAFYELPGLIGTESFPYDVSADGSTIVGESGNTNTWEATVWTSNSGVAGLGSLGSFSSARGVSANGAAISGISNRTGHFEAFLWTAETGIVGLGTLDGTDSQSAVYGSVSDDGSIVVGYSDNAAGRREAFIWSAATGMVGLGTLGGYHSVATSVSGDASTVVGYSSNSLGQWEAFAWTAEGGMRGLGTFGGFSSAANAVSADGSTIVGTSNDATRARAFVWTAATAMVALPEPLLSSNSWAWGISPDGSIILGTSVIDGRYLPVLWRGSERDVIELSTMISQEYGVDLTGWNLDWASAVSADNGTIVGGGFNPSGDYVGWVLVIPKDPVKLLDNLVQDVAQINLDNGISNSLDSKLDAAVSGLFAENADQRQDSVNKLNSFINAVEAQRGKKITEAQADYLIDAATAILSVIE
jgi:probable HAF family extracellular repeat protein